jgi:DDE superfamily endonuclease
VFRSCFTAPVWNRVLVLVAGAVLAPGKRTVTQALRVMGLGEAPQFRRYHEVLGRARWDARAVARRLLLHLLERLLPNGPVVIGIDDTIERRWGARQCARHLPRPGAVLEGALCEDQWSALAVADGGGADKLVRPTLGAAVPDCSRPIGAVERKAPQAAQDADRLGATGDPANQTLAARPLADLCRRQRLRGARTAGLGALPRLCDHTAPAGCRLVQAGAAAPQGSARAPPAQGASSANTACRAGQQEDRLDGRGRLAMVQRPATQAAHRYRHCGLVPCGIPPVPIRWVLVRDPTGEHEPATFLSTDLDATPAMILGWFVSRWRVETTFQEVRTHLGVETQRQWSDLAILRTTPALLGLFSLITVWVDGLVRDTTTALRPNAAAWYRKQEPTFSDAIAAVRRVLWCPPNFSMSRQIGDIIEIPTSLLNRVFQTLCLAA